MKITQQNDYHRTPRIKSYSKYVPFAPNKIIFKPNYIFIFLWAFTLSFSFCPKWIVVWLAVLSEWQNDENNNEQVSGIFSDWQNNEKNNKQVYGIFFDWRQESSWSPHSLSRVKAQSATLRDLWTPQSNFHVFIRKINKQDNNKIKTIRA